MKKRNKIAIYIFLAFYVLSGTYLTVNQERLIYHPNTQDFESCSAFENAEKVTYKGTRMYVDRGGEGIVVLYHGNAGSACDRYFLADEIKKSGQGYVVVEYAGYSNDFGKPSHERIKQDVRNVSEYLEKEKITKVLVLGESIGTGAASYHASITNPYRVVLISPFSSLRDIAKKSFWFYPTSLMVDNAYDNVALLDNIDGPITIIHGSDDKIIPQELSRKLFKSINTNKKTYVSIPGAGHNNLFSFPNTYEELQKALFLIPLPRPL